MKNQDLGYRTYFDQGQLVPIEGMLIEFKHYILPIKESKQRWIILKTIVGFLNSKGGTIYIGVDDRQGQVIGQPISRKQQDQFQLFMKMLIQKIKPQVDLVSKEEVKVAFVPIVHKKIFKGKYIIKIIVSQGDPRKTYHFSSTVDLEYNKKIEQIQVFHGFYRHNMGGIVQIKGEALLEQIANRAANPSEVFNTFPKFSNPEPLKLGGPLTKIGFGGIHKQQLHKRLEQLFHNNLQSFDIQYALTYDVQNHVLLIGLETPEQFKEINQYLRSNLKQLNKDKVFNFVDKGEYLDFYLYKNITGQRSLSIQVKKQKFVGGSCKQQSQVIPVTPTQLPQTKKESSTEPIQPFSPAKKKEDISKREAELYEHIVQTEFVLTITHINRHLANQLLKQLQEIAGQNSTMTVDKYDTSLELRFDTKQHIVQFNSKISKKSQQLNKYGVSGNLVIGINVNSIHIRNYNSGKRRQLKQFVEKLMGKDAKEVEFKKAGNKFFLGCKMASRQLTCSWVDKLLQVKELNQFSIPGADIGQAPKLRVYLQCICNF